MSDLLAQMPNTAELYQSAVTSSEEAKESILKSMQLELDKHRMREVLDIFNNSIMTEVQKNGSYIIWDLVPIICQRLRGLNEFRFKTFNCCRQILLELCEVCNPKELLIIYLSELENDLNLARCAKNSRSSGDGDHEDADDKLDGAVADFEITDSNCFKALLKPFECILLKLPKKRNETLKSVLSSLNDHVSRLSLTAIANFDYEANSRNKLMSDPAVRNLNSVISMYVDFLETFVNEVDITHGDENYQFYSKTSVPNIQRMILLKALLRILDYPLKYMDLSNLCVDSLGAHSKSSSANSTSESHSNGGMIMPSFLDDECVSSRCIAIKVVKLISSLHSNFYTLLNRTDLISSEEVTANNSEFSDIDLTRDHFRSAMSVICYLQATEAELSPSNFMPQVYTHVYNFGVHLPYVRHLLESNQFLVYDKGLELLTELLKHIKEGSLEVKFLDLLRQMPIEKSLISIMVFSHSKSRRTLALDIFKVLVHCLEPIGRFKLLYSILSQPRQHSGFQGIVIGMYKDMMFNHDVFTGANLHRVVRSIISICLPDDMSSDLLEKNDLIFAALNLFRFLFIRDPKATNKTRIWELLPVITDNFLKPLHKAIELSRAHYKLELCKLKEMRQNQSKKVCKKKLKQQQQQNLVSLKVMEGNNQVSLPNPESMTIEQEHNVILLALQNFDVLESLLARVQELIPADQQ